MIKIVCIVAIIISYIACAILVTALDLAMEPIDLEDGMILFMLIIWPIVLILCVIGLSVRASKYLADKIKDKFF